MDRVEGVIVRCGYALYSPISKEHHAYGLGTIFKLILFLSELNIVHMMTVTLILNIEIRMDHLFVKVCPQGMGECKSHQL